MIKFRRNTIIAIVFISLIIILASAFHYPIQIVDAISSSAAQGFDIKISTWRIIFEPITGFLLFYLRADQPMNEFFMLMLWVICLILAISLFSALKNRKKNIFIAIKNGLLQWLVRVPIIVILWLALLLIIIFMPLPSNTIVNNHADTILINVHSHSHFSHDGIISPEGQMKWHRRNGFDAFFLSEHNHHVKTFEIVETQKKGQLPPKPLVLCGEEFSGTNHILLLGLKRNFKTRGMPDSVAIDSTHANDGVAIVAHWFRDQHRTLDYYVQCGIDGFEIANQASGIRYDRQVFTDIVEICSENGLLMLGACDYHGYGSVCFVWNALKIPEWHEMNDEQQRESIIELLRRHDQENINVLIYRDRTIFDRSKLIFSPIFSFISYFRSLDFYRVLSWVIWTIACCLIFRSKRQSKNPLFTWGTIGLVSALFVTTVAIVLLLKAPPLAGYNEIFSEYGNLFLWIGLGFGFYSLIIIAKNR